MANDAAYPGELRTAEASRVRARREAALQSSTASTEAPVGLALSGGGIRSATFSLGVLQALAGANLIRRIDYLSTVSGGGYVGGFFGALFARPNASAASVTGILDPKRADESGEVAWLRENGRYLAPNGGSDAWAALASGLRGWAAVVTVIALLLLLGFLTFYPLRQLLGLAMPQAAPIWASPFWLLTLLPLLAVVPLAWAYWGIEKTANWRTDPLISLALVAIIAGVTLALAGGVPEHVLIGAGVLLMVSLATGICVACAFRAATRKPDGSHGAWFGAKADSREANEQRDQARRNLTRWLSRSLVTLVGVVLIASVDSLGFLIYLLQHLDQESLAGVVASLSAAALLLSQRLSLIDRLLKSFTGNERFSLPSGLLMWLVAAVAAVGVVALTNAGAHAIAWRFSDPLQPEAVNEKPTPPSTIPTWAGSTTQGARITIVNPLPAQPAPTTPIGARQLQPLPTEALWWPAVLWGLLLFLNIQLGRNWAFVNRSSHQALYAARLKRTYLGASNPERTEGSGNSRVTDPLPGDDIEMADYWAPSNQQRGAPLHLVNVTINQTVSRRQGTVNRDRKGIPMAIGPCGLSAGARHHYLLDPEHPSGRPESAGRYWMFEGIAPPKRKAGATEKGYKQLTLGNWIAISGAAFSTGTGYHTTVASSLLTGLANIRLGYWWRSGTRPKPVRRTGTPGEWKIWARLMHAFAWLFQVQWHLFAELLARFHGPGRSYWYLSDGGHFENMGGYELIRRRLPFIVIVDGEEDPDYQFEGLASLVRKARTDFSAEIRFLDPADANTPAEIRLLVKDPAFSGVFGTLADLAPDQKTGQSRARACFASVSYADDPEARSLIVYLKPTLGRETPVDVREYQRRNPKFPQQPTADQFFDEVQWESYRRLGLEIGQEVFKAHENLVWCPGKMRSCL